MNHDRVRRNRPFSQENCVRFHEVGTTNTWSETFAQILHSFVLSAGEAATISHQQSLVDKQKRTTYAGGVIFDATAYVVPVTPFGANHPTCRAEGWPRHQDDTHYCKVLQTHIQNGRPSLLAYSPNVFSNKPKVSVHTYA